MSDSLKTQVSENINKSDDILPSQIANDLPVEKAESNSIDEAIIENMEKESKKASVSLQIDEYGVYINILKSKSVDELIEELKKSMPMDMDDNLEYMKKTSHKDGSQYWYRDKNSGKLVEKDNAPMGHDDYDHSSVLNEVLNKLTSIEQKLDPQINPPVDNKMTEEPLNKDSDKSNLPPTEDNNRPEDENKEVDPSKVQMSLDNPPVENVKDEPAPVENAPEEPKTPDVNAESDKTQGLTMEDIQKVDQQLSAPEKPDESSEPVSKEESEKKETEGTETSEEHKEHEENETPEEEAKEQEDKPAEENKEVAEGTEKKPELENKPEDGDKSDESDSNIDPEELKMGIEHEKEHTDDPEVAKKIAMDHLKEIPDYYTRLNKMEAEFKNKKDEEVKKSKLQRMWRVFGISMPDKLDTESDIQKAFYGCKTLQNRVMNQGKDLAFASIVVLKAVKEKYGEGYSKILSYKEMPSESVYVKPESPEHYTELLKADTKRRWAMKEADLSETLKDMTKEIKTTINDDIKNVMKSKTYVEFKNKMKEVDVEEIKKAMDNRPKTINWDSEEYPIYDEEKVKKSLNRKRK